VYYESGTAVRTARSKPMTSRIDIMAAVLKV